MTIDDWLDSLSLSNYSSSFRVNFFTSMDRVSAIWDDELTSILDVEKIGHRKRILVSVAGKEGVAGRVGNVKEAEAKVREMQHKLTDSRQKKFYIKEHVASRKSNSMIPSDGNGRSKDKDEKGTKAIKES
jgi:hypothetical protein